jgi:hypothetical protein
MDATPVSAARVARAAEHLDTEHEALAGLMVDPETRVTRLPVSCFAEHEVWRFEKFTPRRPVVFFVISSASSSDILTARPDAWNRAAAADSGGVGDTDGALATARAFVEATRVQNRRVQPVTSTDSLPWRPGLAAEESGRRDAVTGQVAAGLAAEVEPDGHGFSVRFGVVEGMDLLRHTYAVARDGSVRLADRTTLAADLPFTYAA